MPKRGIGDLLGKRGSAESGSLDLTGKVLAGSPKKPEDVAQRYQTLFEIGKELLAESDIDRVLTLAMDRLIEISGAERGLIVLFGEGKKVLFETARNLEKEDIDHPEFEISRTIMNKVKKERRPVCLSNALEDPTLRKSKSTVRLKILSVICLPLIHGKNVFGVVYLDNRTVRGAFTLENWQFSDDFADFISLAAHNALERKRQYAREQALEEELRMRFDFETIVGHSPKMVEVMDVVSQVADTDAPVLIEGETGTGKELVVRAIHSNSRRRDKPMVTINCGVIPETFLESELFGHEKGAFTGAATSHRGKFEQADKGTIFLDEVDEMSPALQVKLLRILQWGEFTPLGSENTKHCNVRIVAASKRPLKRLLKKGSFRDDLYYRLNLIRIEMPRLRERTDDIPLLANYFLQDACKDLSKTAPSLSSEVQQVLRNYEWPGNVRELENVMRRVAILCNLKTVKLEHLPPEVRLARWVGVRTGKETFLSFQEAKSKTVESFERRYLTRVLEESGGVIRKAAERAGMHEKNFHEKLKRYGLRPSKS